MKNHLKVRGLEALNESPVINIKPFVRMAHGTENPSVAEWMATIHAELENPSGT